MKELDINQERLSTLQTDKIMVEHLHRYAIALELVSGKTILDIASGEGYGSNLLSKKAKKVYGVDISNEAIQHSKEKYKNPNLEYIQGSATEIPLEDSSVDIIVTFETIEHHDEHIKMMEECKRVLKHDGLMIISSPDKLNYSDIPNYNNSYHVKELYSHEFNQLLQKYFKKISLYNQRYINGSVIESLENSTCELFHYQGTYYEIIARKNITPMYNIAIVSDHLIPFLPSSVFEHVLPVDNSAEEMEKKYINSTTWKVGKALLTPLFFVKSLFQK